MPNHRKSNETHRLHGTFRADRHGGGRDWPVDQSIDPAIIPPEHNAILNDYGRDFWHRVAPVLWSYGLLTALDLHAFALLSHLYGDWREVSRQLDEVGLISEHRRGMQVVSKPHPLVSVRNKIEALLFSMMEQFGMSPRSRKSLGIDMNANNEESSKLDRFLKLNR